MHIYCITFIAENSRAKPSYARHLHILYILITMFHVLALQYHPSPSTLWQNSAVTSRFTFFLVVISWGAGSVITHLPPVNFLIFVALLLRVTGREHFPDFKACISLFTSLT